MSEVRDADKFVEAVLSAILPRLQKAFARTADGIVASVSGPTAHVRVKGDSKATPMERCCDVKAGDRVLLLRQGTRCIVIGVYR